MNRLDLETLGSWLIMPKILPGHYIETLFVTNQKLGARSSLQPQNADTFIFITLGYEM